MATVTTVAVAVLAVTVLADARRSREQWSSQQPTNKLDNAYDNDQHN